MSKEPPKGPKEKGKFEVIGQTWRKTRIFLANCHSTVLPSSVNRRVWKQSPGELVGKGSDHLNSCVFLSLFSISLEQEDLTVSVPDEKGSVEIG